MARRQRLNQDGERWLYLWFAVAFALVLSLAMVLEWAVAVTWWRPYLPSEYSAASMVPSVWLATFVPTLLGVLALFPVYPAGRPRWWRVSMVVLVTLLLLPLRAAAQLALWGAYGNETSLALDTFVGSLTSGAAIGLAVYLAGTQMAAVKSERLAAQHEFQSRQAALVLENEELRVRREVSDTLHGRIQQRLVFLGSQIEQVRSTLHGSGQAEAASRLQAVIADLDELRETDVRALSHSLFPLGVDVGLTQALTLQVSRIPAQIEASLDITDAAAALDSLTGPGLELAERVLLAQVAEEGVTNAIKHGEAKRIWITLDVDRLSSDADGDHLELCVRNNGQPVAPEAQMSGLGSLKTRARQHGGDLALTAGGEGRVVLRAWIKHHRPPADQEAIAALEAAPETPVVAVDTSPSVEAAQAAVQVAPVEAADTSPSVEAAQAAVQVAPVESEPTTLATQAPDTQGLPAPAGQQDASQGAQASSPNEPAVPETSEPPT
ncbi:MAG: hypothetical protein FWD29_03110 [Micrococcales bacterium]|nr:hypothetical protein [Micrococcales bacterium]